MIKKTHLITRRRVHKIVKSLLASSHLPVPVSVCSHEINRLPLNGFSLNLIFEYFLKICRKKFKSD